MRKIAINNFKGGINKTTTEINLSHKKVFNVTNKSKNRQERYNK